ncbi:MAG: Ig-like domain-containing protein, partial [Gammaproteobacteria bacterium]|nr:Ig-like domain-containing protein [Gammaproteobacteria bacterium]
CAFVSGGQSPTTLDGLVISTDTGGAAGSDGCRIIGTLTPVATPAATERSYVVSARSADNRQFTVAVVVTVMGGTMPPPPTGGAAPVLVVETYESDIINNLPIAVLIRNTNPAVPLTAGSCRAVNAEGVALRPVIGEQQVRQSGLLVAENLPALDACVIGGAYTAAGSISIFVRAINEQYMSNIVRVDFYGRIATAISFAEKEVSRFFDVTPFTIIPNAQVPLRYTWTSTVPTVATVDNNGQVSVVGLGETVIMASYVQGTLYAASDDAYTLTVAARPPSLTTPPTALAVAGQALDPVLSVPNASAGADIAACFLLDGATPLATLEGLDILKASDGRSCTISGAPTMVGDRTFTVRATSAFTRDDVTANAENETEVNITVFASTQAVLRTAVTEFEVELDEPIDTVTLANINTVSTTALATGNCVLVDDMGAAISSALANNEYTVEGLVVATDVTKDTCTVTGTPATAGRHTLRVRADNTTGDGSGNIVELTFIVRDIDTPAFAEASATVRIDAGTYTNVLTASSPVSSFTWVSSNTAVATVDANGEITILTSGTTTITATRELSDSFLAANLFYTLMIDPYPPILPVGPVLADAADEMAINDLTLENTGAVITRCVFVSGGVEMSIQSGLFISGDAGGLGCTIRGTITGDTGSRSFTVRAIAAGGQVDVVVTFMVASKPLGSATQVASGLNNTCAISADGELFCWGSNAVGDNFNTPNRLSKATDWKEVSAGNVHNCAVNTTNRPYCWGGNGDRVFGNGLSANSIPPLLVEQFRRFVRLSAGPRHTCGISGSSAGTTGTLHCWGIGAGHRLGLGTEANKSFAAQLGSDNTWTQISVGSSIDSSHSCATNAAGQLYCWGSGSSGQTGQGGTPTSTTVSTTPAQVGMATNWAQVSAGAAHTCALNTDDELYCWGESDSGRLGLGAVSADGASPAE